MKLNIKFTALAAVFIAALMLLTPISQINTSGGGGSGNYDLDFLNSLDINNNHFVLSADSLSNSVDINDVEVANEGETKELQYGGTKVGTTTFISVSDVAGLNKLSNLVNDVTTPFDFSGYTIVLTADLDFIGEASFNPIGNGSNNFNGTFDGQGHTISNLQVSDVIYAGLFGVLGDKSTAMNLKITNFEISTTSTSNFAYLGGIAGWNSGTIENCYNTGIVTVEATSSINSAYLGGIAAHNGGKITNCYNSGTVTATTNNFAFSGGITGQNSGTITNCYNTGHVTATATNGTAYSGGIAGYGSGGKIENCYNIGDVTAISTVNSTNNFAFSGGIAGRNDGAIENCYSTGIVTATAKNSAYLGGIAGYNSKTITNCYNTGNVTATHGNAYSGGIAGYNFEGTITNCYNAGDMTSETIDSKSDYAYLGGIAGYNFGTIINCYNTGNVTATAKNSANSGGIAGYNPGGTIINCYNTGNVTAESTNNFSYSGGIAGLNDDGGTITNCYNTGNVTAESKIENANSGGITGRNWGGTIENCYNTGTMSADSESGDAYSGGIAGFNDGSTLIKSCYSKVLINQELIGNNVGADGCKFFDADGLLSGRNGSLLDALNEWVTEANKQNPALDIYRYWMNPFIQDENKKYPVFTDWYGEAKRLGITFPDPNDKGVYVIENEYQLALIAANDNLDGNYVLADDIDLSGYEWRPIGDKTNQFSGTFDGNGHTISNLSVNIDSKSGNVYAGLFGYLGSNATVKNLGIIDSVIFTNTTYKGDDRAFSGGIVGYNTGTVTDCYYTGTVIGTGAVTFGGIVGENKNGTVSNCHNTGTVIGTETSGGILGYNSGTVTNCYNTGVVIADTANGTANSGGIVGNNAKIVTNCYNTGFVTATANNSANSGGITGNNYQGKIKNCYNTGVVIADFTKGEAYSGGIVGYNSGTITNCYNIGTVKSTSTNSSAYSGGIAGYNQGTIENCYNTGVVIADFTKGEAYSGGITGNNFQGKIKNCYNSGAVNGIHDSGGITGNNYQGTIENCYNTGAVNGSISSGGIVGWSLGGTITNCYNSGAVSKATNSGGIVGRSLGGTITNCYNSGAVSKATNSGGIVGWSLGGTIENCYYLKDCVLNGTNNEGTELASDEMKELKLLGGDGSKHDLNNGQASKPWSPDIFNVNNGYPILADVPTQIDPNSANEPPQSAVYVTLDTEKDQAENYLKPFIGTNGNEVTATINYLINPDKDITSYQWYTMDDKGVFIEVNKTSSPGTIQETYYVKVTIDGYSYTSLTRTVSDTFIVMFDNNGGSGVDSIMVSKNKIITKPEDPIKTGYTFEGWYTDTECNVEYNFGTSVTENTILYAKWEAIKYTVKYDSNGSTSGDVPTDDKEYEIDNPINLASNEGNLAKSEHIFRGWNYTPNASSALSSPITLTKDVIEKYINKVPNNTTLTLYAVWTPIPEPIYTLCLNSNDSTLQTKRYSGTYGTEVTLKSASDFGWNESCKFIEWNSKSDGSGISYKEGDKFSLGSDVWNLYAIWSDSSYHTVSFNSNGGNSIPSQSIQDGYRASEPTDPEKQGHSFKHWSLNGVKYDFNQSVKEDITLKAEYEIISYKVTFYYNGDVYYSTVADYNTSLGNKMPSLPSDKDGWNTSENGKGSNFTADSLITSDTSVYAVSESSLTSILIIGGSAAAILAAIAAWLFMRSRYN